MSRALLSRLVVDLVGAEGVAHQPQQAEHDQQRRQHREAERDRGLRGLRLGHVAVGARAVAADGQHEREQPGAQREAERLAGGPDAGVDADPRAPGPARVDGRRVGEHREREDLAAGVPDTDQRDRGDDEAERRRAGQHGQQRAGGEDDGRGQVALLLADPRAEGRPRRREQQRRTDEADEQHGRRALAVEHVGRHVVDSREHAAGGERLHDEGDQQQPEVARAGDDPQLVAQRARPGLDRTHRGVPGAPVGGHHADDDDQRHRDPHHAVAGPAADRIADHRSGRSGQHDREGEDRHPPGHQPGALVVRRGHLRGHRHVGHLEERVRRRAGQEADQHPGRLGHLASPSSERRTAARRRPRAPARRAAATAAADHGGRRCGR